MTVKRYDVIDKEEPRGQSVTYDGMLCTARTCVTRLNRLTKENEQLKQQIHYLKIVCRNELDDEKPAVEEMQEWNKRFRLDILDPTSVVDTADGGEFWTVHGNEAYNLCILLNELSEENERLKEYNNGFAKME